MATKTDYYNRIISSLQADITSLKTSFSILKKGMEKIHYIPIKDTDSFQLSKQDKTDLVEQLVKECYITFDNKYSNLSSKFVDMVTFRNYCGRVETKYLPSEMFNIFKNETETRLKLIENRRQKGFVLLSVNRWKRDCDASGLESSGLDTFLHTFTMNRYTRWLLIFLIIFSLTMALLFAVSENRHIRRENYTHIRQSN